jgi:hypothetical protein
MTIIEIQLQQARACYNLALRLDKPFEELRRLRLRIRELEGLQKQTPPVEGGADGLKGLVRG